MSGFVRQSTFAKRLYKKFLLDKVKTVVAHLRETLADFRDKKNLEMNDICTRDRVMAHISRCWCIKPTCIKHTSRNVHPARFSEEVATSQFALTPAGFKRQFERMLAPIVEGTTCWNLIAVSIYDEYSAGPSILQICTRRFFTMLNMIQACSHVY